MLLFDLNCDMGEGVGNDEMLMPWITSANIACGFHAGSGSVIHQTIDLALKYNVKIGAHPSFRDKENFGRKEFYLNADKIYALVMEQLIRIDLIAKDSNTTLHHIKPHGALYNMGARDPHVARIIAQAAKDFNEDLVLYGLSGSALISEANAIGLKTFREAFADRTYQDDGSLTPRSQFHALIEDEDECIRQVMQIVNDGSVTTVSGKKIPMIADTICLHSDGKHALDFARILNKALQQQNIASQPAQNANF